MFKSIIMTILSWRSHVTAKTIATGPVIIICTMATTGRFLRTYYSAHSAVDLLVQRLTSPLLHPVSSAFLISLA